MIGQSDSAITLRNYERSIINKVVSLTDLVVSGNYTDDDFCTIGPYYSLANA